ncbi:hypothetical protein PDJAM_G00150410 [Pangasius djambal]|uniref:Uncharacterized protein n=1 Tax=Pangasius djambal TaxID=1691987 RepID=A0ACC5ZHW0_9TELE|nr:hypothetical protein [Pangasius djambal]
MAEHKPNKEQRYDRQLRTYGLVGYMRLAVKEHTVVESHPDSALEDLRLDTPFSELRNYINSYDLDSMDKKDHSHTPWIIIIAKYLEKWYSEHDFQLPKNYKEKEAFRQLIRDVVESHPDSALEDLRLDTPFSELRNYINSYDLDSMDKKDHSHTPWIIIIAKYLEKWYSEHDFQLPKNYKEKEAFRQLIRDASCMDNPDSEMVLYLMLRSVDRFYQQHSRYPGVYNYQVEEDISRLKVCVNSLLQEYSLNVNVKDDYVHEFCRYGAAEPHTVAALLGASCMDNPDSEMVLYLMLRSVDRFYQQHSRYPGVYNYQVEEDISRLKVCVNSLLQEYSLNVNVKDDYVHEFCRYGAAEPHTVAALLGGAAAQEAIKLITHQFVPFNNTFIYNAMAQTSATFQL